MLNHLRWARKNQKRSLNERISLKKPPLSTLHILVCGLYKKSNIHRFCKPQVIYGRDTYTDMSYMFIQKTTISLCCLLRSFYLFVAFLSNVRLRHPKRKTTGKHRLLKKRSTNTSYVARPLCNELEVICASLYNLNYECHQFLCFLEVSVTHE